MCADSSFCPKMLTFGKFQVKSERLTVVNGPPGIQTKGFILASPMDKYLFLLDISNFTTPEKHCLPGLLFP